MNYRIFILVVGTFIIGTDDFVIAGILPSIAEDMNVSIAISILFTAFIPAILPVKVILSLLISSDNIKSFFD